MTPYNARSERLFRRHRFGIKLGLDRMSDLLDRLGRPEKQLAVVHVAGTNGKGSVCALVESALRAAGYPTGLYTSPHLVRLNERIQAGGRCIDDADLWGLADEIEALAPDVESRHGELTFFEFTTALAFEYFRRRGARIVVAETGMGGRLDATNVVLPLVSVITDISLEHTRYLGPDIPSIAGEKAGIVKAGRPVICGQLPPEALDAVRQRAVELGAPVVLSEESASVRRVRQSIEGQTVSVSGAQQDYGTMRLPLLGRHQLANAALAVTVLESLRGSAGLRIGTDALRTGFEGVRWPARCQALSASPPVLLDGAHNPGAAMRLAQTLRELAGRKPIGLVFGLCDDKDLKGFIHALGSLVRRCWTVTMKTERSMPAETLASAVRAAGWEASVAADLPGALAASKEWAEKEGGLVCIAGSLYLAGEVLECLGIEPFGER